MEEPPAFFQNLNLAVVGGIVPEDVPLDKPPPNPTYPNTFDDSVFVRARQRMDERDAENRHSGSKYQ